MHSSSWSIRFCSAQGIHLVCLAVISPIMFFVVLRGCTDLVNRGTRSPKPPIAHLLLLYLNGLFVQSIAKTLKWRSG